MKVRNEKPVEQVVDAIQAMDLDPIKFKLMDADEGEGWSREQVDRIETAYRQFLTLLVKYPESTIAPSKEVDKFWHGHILDTMKYAEDCEQVFGYFLHHFPYFGMRGADDAAQLDAAGKETRRLMASEFGAEAGNPSYCFAAQKTEAAYCFAAKQADAAYCFAAKPSYCFAAKESQEAAYCFATKPSYCFAAKDSQEAAYCFAAKPANEASYCFAAKPSYCFAAKETQDAAYCFAAKKADAYCFASKPSQAKVDIQTRPTLALAA